jgi:hypothetical protein
MGPCRGGSDAISTGARSCSAGEIGSDFTSSARRASSPGASGVWPKPLVNPLDIAVCIALDENSSG